MLLPVLNSFKDKDVKVQQAACDAMFNIIKICKEAILKDKVFVIFDAVIDLIADFHSEIKEWAKKVDDLLKDVVYNSLSKYLHHFTHLLIDF